MGKSIQNERSSTLCCQQLNQESRFHAQIEQANNLQEEESGSKEITSPISTQRKSPWLFEQSGALLDTVKLSNLESWQSGPAIDRSGFHVSGNISNGSCAEIGSERRHAVFAIGDLVSDGLFMAFVVVGEVSL